MTAALENAVVRLLKRSPFYGHLLLGCRRTAASAHHPVGLHLSGGTPVISCNTECFSSFSPREQEALLEHVLKHLLHLHLCRRRERNPRDWDLATDLAINGGIEGLPGGSLLPERFALPTGLSAEEYYRLLVSPFDTGSMAGGGIGDASPDDSGERSGAGSERTESSDDHSAWEESDSFPLVLAEEMLRSMVRDACRNASGELPDDVRALVEGMLAPSPLPWRQVLRQFVASAGRIGRSATWRREHRRFSHETPGIRKKRRLNLLVGVDVSESTDQAPLREAFGSELAAIARGRESQITVLYANSRIRRIDSLKGRGVMPEVYRGGGFTDLRPVFDYAREMHPRPAAVIYLTDGKGPAPEKMEIPTLWVLTRDGERPAPWGVELRLRG